MHWEQCLAEAGCRVTEPRRVVMQVLREAAVPLSPQEILNRGRARHQDLGLVTVYRTLSLFVDLHLVRRAHGEAGCHAYLLASPGHRHAVVCRQCGRAAEFEGQDDLHELIERVEAKTGYQIEEHLLQLSGLCTDCRESAEWPHAEENGK
ncbi:MAG: Fur family transcriptional regulator [Anaerolineae bacterium]